MSDKIIFPENLDGRTKTSLKKLMNMTPEKDRKDENLKRLIVFRLKLDGETKTMKYLKNHLERALKTGYNGAIYEFIMSSAKHSAPPSLTNPFFSAPPKDDPPDEIG